MDLAGVTIAFLHPVLCLKPAFSDGLGGSCCLRLLFFQQETFVGGVYFGRTFPSGLGCGNVYFRNVCE